jgi:hypothetical protein
MCMEKLLRIIQVFYTIIEYLCRSFIACPYPLVSGEGIKCAFMYHILGLSALFFDLQEVNEFVPG